MPLPHRSAIALPLLLVCILLVHACDRPAPRNNGSPSGQERTSAPAPMSADTTAASQEDTAALTHLARIRTTLGTFTVALYGKDAPRTVNNFVGLARKGRYNRVLFHRVARGFVVQTGDPKTRTLKKREEWGTGGESLYGKPFDDELYPESPSYQDGYVRGTVAMANNGPNTNTSQFFICLADVPDLPRNFTIFGRVIEGMDVVDSIGTVDIEPVLDATDGIPVEPVAIRSVKVSTYRNR